MTPIDEAMREIAIEMEAVRTRIGNGPMPDRLVVTVEFDREKGHPRLVEVEEQRRRRVLGAAVDQRRRIA